MMTRSNDFSLIEKAPDYGNGVHVPASQLCLHESFEAWVDRSPDGTAIFSIDASLTFAQLDARANCIARALLRQGIAAEEPVGVLVDRSADLPLAFLAILKAGGAYVPLLAELPPRRLGDMARQAGMRRIIALDGLQPPAELLAALADNGGGAATLVLIPEQVLAASLPADAERPSLPVQPGRLAAILFTSGSTGTPKGVLIQHDACLDMAMGHAFAQGVRAEDRVLLSSSPGFILGFRELFLPLALGCAWVPASRELLERPADLIASMEKRGVTVALFTPSYLRLFNKVVPAGLRLILTAGERPHADDARHYARHLTYWNLHGATEVCGTFAMHQVMPGSEDALPSGRPFPNTTIVLLDENGDLAAPGCDGEIFVISPRVSRGYLKQDGLTAESFVETRFGRTYRTRDLGRWTAEGELLTLGRLGDMIKVSGQAVALGEIEHALRDHGQVHAAAIIQHRDRLVGFVEPLPGKDIASVDWSAFLGQRLPAYMLPARTLTVASLPVSSAAKLDRLALIALAEQDWQEQRGAGGPAQGAAETIIAAVWADVLGLNPATIGRDDNFFRIGGSSLLAIKAGQKLQAAGLPATVRDILASLNIAALAQLLSAASQAAGDETGPDFDHTPLATAGQTDFWVAAALGLPVAGSHIARALRLTGASPAPSEWREAWSALVRHHPALRTGLSAAADGTVRLRTLPADDANLHIPFELVYAADEREAGRFLHEQTSLPFDLSCPPLARAGLIRLADSAAPLFWFVLHHAMADGMSATQIQQDLLTLLGGGKLAPAIDGPRLASRAEQAHLASPMAERDRVYWLGLLEPLASGDGAEAFEALPFDRSATTSDTDDAAPALTRTLDAGTARRLTALANRHGAGLHALLLALLAAEAGRRTDRAHVLIGSGIATRPAGAEDQIGHFVNLLPLPLPASSGNPLAKGLHKAQAALTGAVANGLYPARRIAQDLNQRHPGLRRAGQLGLVDIALTANPQRAVRDPGSGHALARVDLPGEAAVPAAGLSLSFSHEPSDDGGVILSLVWNAAVAGRAEAEAWLESLTAWAAWLAMEPSRLNAPLPALLPGEVSWLSGVEQGPVHPRSNEPAHRLVERIADETPDSPAVVTRTQTVTYGELDRNANRIAAALLARGLRAEEPVAVLADNGPWLPAAILGIWKAGGIYVPLTAEMPVERAGTILQDTGAQHLIVLPETDLPPALGAGRTLLHPETLTGAPSRPDLPIPGDATAYIIFTSGTTGAPKGTVVRHDGMINAILCTLEALGKHPHDRIAVMATPSFDASLWEHGMALFHGLPMVPVTRAEREDPWSMKDLFGDLGVTVAFQAPSYLRVSQDKPFAPTMRALLVGGEAPSRDDLGSYPGIDFWNAYGPTETSIIVSLGHIAADHPAGQPLHVGPPMANAVISIRRADGTRVPPGCTGEVWLGGVGVGAGYLNNPETTARVFIDTAEGRMYRSGDLGRWSRQGTLELAGRIDQQVKLHGQRVEPAEIEQHLQAHPAVRQASVIVDKGAGDTKLLRGFVHLKDDVAALPNAAWRDFLADRLPPHMVPATVIAVPRIPFTPNGKLDRKQLLAALRDQKADMALAVSRTPPSGPLEQRIAAVWAELLGGGDPSGLPIAREDNFFALGGDSLRAITMSQKLLPLLGTPVSARDLFAAPTLAAFAARVASAGESHAAAPAVPLDGALATEGENEFWTAQQAGLDTSGHIVLTIRQITGPMPDRAAWTAAWNALVERQAGLRMAFAPGPDGRLRRQSPTTESTSGLEWQEAADSDAALRLIRARQLAPFDMACPPLWRGGLVQIADSGQWLFWLALHHAISDGRSLGVITGELAALLDGRPLPPLAASPSDIAQREQAYLAGPERAQDEAWWSQEIAAVPDRAFRPLSLDHPRRIDDGIATHRFRIVLPQALAQDLRTLAGQNAISLYALLLSLLAIEARQRDGRDWLVLGTTISTLENADEAALVGYGVNMLPLFLRMDGDASTAQFLQTCQKALLGALQHARYPFARIYEKAWRRRPALRDPLRFPLFDIAVTENPPAAPGDTALRFDRLATDDLDYELTESAHGQDMVLVHESLPDGTIALEWHANANLFTRESAAGWLDGIQHWAAVLASHGDLAALPLPGAQATTDARAPVAAPTSWEAPLPGMEQQIATLWAELLGIALPARGDNFFALGGNSLLAITMAHRLTAILRRPVAARDLFAAPVLADFVARLARTEHASNIPPAHDGRRATDGEREFWTAWQAGLDTSGHIMPLIRRINGPVAPAAAWQAAWSALVARHPALRCRFHEADDGTLLREVLQPAAVTRAFELADAATTDEALDHIRARQSAPMDLADAPLWRAGLVTVAQDGASLFWLAQHHATGDGRSIGVLTGELLALLAGDDLPALAETPETISAREQAYMAREAGADAQWWAKRLASLPASAFDDWETDFPRSLRTSGSHHYATSLTSAEAAALTALARRHSASLHAVLLALLAHVVHRRTGRQDFLIGTTATVPESAAEAAVVHYGVNMLPLRFASVGSGGFEALLRHARDELNDALTHARYPFARIYQDLRAARPGANHPGRYPVFDIAITENPAAPPASTATHFDQIAPFSRQAQGGDDIRYERMPNPPGQDMVLTYQRLDDGGLLLDWQMNAAIYHADIAAFWMEGLADAAHWLAAHPAAGSELPSPSPAEWATLAGWSEGAAAPRPSGTFADLFEATVDRPGQASRPAVLTEIGDISYGALDRQANALAHRLIADGVRPGQVVAVLTGRSARLPAAMLAVWKAGAVYLPLMASLPEERLAFMAGDAGATVLLALDGIIPPAAISLPVVLDTIAANGPDHRPRIAGSAQDHAYILYTSGSTGQPKGVPLSHGGYVNLVLGSAEGFGLTPQDRCLGFAAPSFDVSLSDVGIPLAAGAALYPLAEGVLSQPSAVADIIARQRITLADLPPSYLRLLDTKSLSGLRILVTGGEAPLPADVARLAGNLAYFNAYGATEASITSAMGQLAPDQADGLDCGRPLPNTGLEIRDPATGAIVPPGASGEIWLSGTGLASAYLNRPSLTGQAFLQTGQGPRYRTGDLGRWRGGGRVELLGRIDQQVKLNGIRIEPGEIEAAIASHPSVLQAVAAIAGSAAERQSLWAFIVPAGGDVPSQSEWKAFLGRRLPGYMIPAGLQPVAAIPMTPSGKIDRKALLAGLDRQRSAPATGSAPEPGLESAIADLWTELLACGPVHREDNFFSLGGHSLLAIALCHRLERSLSCPIPAHWLFADPVLSDFAARVAERSAESQLPAAPTDIATEGEREFWIAEQSGRDTAPFTMTLTLAVEGDVPDDAAWQSAWALLVERHDALRTRFAADADGETLRREVLGDMADALALASAPARDIALAAIADAQSAPFAMERGPLCRAGLTRVAEGPPIFWLALHHSVGDGVSLSLLVRDLAALLAGKALPPLTTCYAESASRQQAYLASAAADADGAWWQERLCRIAVAGDDAFADWPTDRPHALVQGTGTAMGSHVLRYHMTAEQAQRLRQIARAQASSLHALMLAMMGLEIKRRTGRGDFLLGTAASTRASAAEAEVIGYYVNQLPVPCHFADIDDAASALERTRKVLAEALAHSAYPFSRVVRDFRRDHPDLAGSSRHPLFDLAVTENPSIAADTPGEALRLTPLGRSELPPPGTLAYDRSTAPPPQDMLLIHEGTADGGLALSWLVNAQLHDKGSAEAWLAGLVGSLAALLDQPVDAPLPLLLPAECAQLEHWEQGEAIPAPAATMAELFSCHAAEGPGRPAIITDSACHSYAEINRAAQALAARLRDLHVRPGGTVGVYTERSASLPMVVLAIWQAGACYLPLVEGLPEDRLAFTARDASIDVLLVLDGLAPPEALLAGAYSVLHLGDALAASADIGGTALAPIAASPAGPAVILYTSGSTGTPKGVVMSHAGVMNLGLGLARMHGTTERDRTLSITSPSFDLWLSDLVGTWFAAAAILPATRAEMEDLDHMRGKMRRLGVTIATMTPSYLRMFDRAEFPDLRLLMTVGEAPVLTDARFYAERLAYCNGYGPTENTAATTIGVIDPDDDPLPAGRPMPNVSVMILDEAGQRVPPGSIGEAWIGGASVAIGYANRPDLTEQAFVETPFGRMYRSGDMARWRHDGQLIVLGRIDGQVKLRGQRVELGEIEQALIAHPLVSQAAAVVTTAPDGGQTLSAFAVPAAGEADWPDHAEWPDDAEWKAFLGKSLPGYMIPARLLRVGEIAMTPSGKIDRKALIRQLADVPADAAAASAHNPPAGLVENTVAKAWASILDRPLPSRGDHFFELGGDSLKAIAVITRLRQHFDMQINDLYEHPVLEDFALCCKARPDHLRESIHAAAAHWQDYQGNLAAYDAAREAALTPAEAHYAKRNRVFAVADLARKSDYRQVLLTGGTGYVGIYLLRRLLETPRERVTALVRAGDDGTARQRLLDTFAYYFGADKAARLAGDERLAVRAGDLRLPDLGLGRSGFDHLAEQTDAILHSAANVRHFGHYRDFLTDNVDATAHLVDLAARRAAWYGGSTADLHVLSTISVSGAPPEDGFRLFTEYDAVPDQPDRNYYIRSKQEAERLAERSRDRIGNVCIHRVGNIVFAADGGPLQRNIRENAFFRMLGALARIGVVPNDSHVWLCHVDVVAAAVVALAETPALANLRHHVEHARRDSLADFITGAASVAGTVQPAEFGSFLNRVAAAVDRPELETALAEILESFGLLRGVSPQSRGRRLEVCSDRTQQFLRRMGIAWPEIPPEGQASMIAAALELKP